MPRQTLVQLTSELVERLDDEAARRRVSRSAIIREAVSEHLAHSPYDVISRRIVAGYRAIPAATPDEWSSLEQSGDVSTREILQRLDAEERAAGLDPW
ncbi:MAG: CopG family transcriptional regulator [Acidimicrobiales bacterium]